LGRFAVSLDRVRIEQVSRLRRQGQSSLALAQFNQLDEPLIVEVLKGVLRKIEIVFRYDAERTDGRECAAVFAVKFVDSVTLNDKFAFVPARQVEVAHHPITRIKSVSVSRFIHLYPIALAPFTVARVVSRIEHGSPSGYDVRWKVREGVRAVAAGAIQEAMNARGIAPVAFRPNNVEPCSVLSQQPTQWFSAATSGAEPGACAIPTL
jgi:hypothetical protein